MSNVAATTTTTTTAAADVETVISTSETAAAAAEQQSTATATATATAATTTTMVRTTHSTHTTHTTHTTTTVSDATTFPFRFFRFLTDAVEQYDISHIVSWQPPYGHCFRIHQPKEFIALTEPSWFVYKKYSSFQRQLNIYGFTRITANGMDKNCYYHEYFRRGHDHLLHRIMRVPTKKNYLLEQLPSSTRRPYRLPEEDDHDRERNEVDVPINHASTVQEQQHTVTLRGSGVFDTTNKGGGGGGDHCNHPLISAPSPPTNDALLLHMMMLEQSTSSRLNVATTSDIPMTLQPTNSDGVPTELSMELYALLSQVQREELNLETRQQLLLQRCHRSMIRASMMLQPPSYPSVAQSQHPAADLMTQLVLLNDPQSNPTSQQTCEPNVVPRLLSSERSLLGQQQHLQSDVVAIEMNQRNKLLQAIWKLRDEELRQHILQTDISSILLVRR